MTRQIAVIGECMVELRRAGQGLLAQGFGATPSTPPSISPAWVARRSRCTTSRPSAKTGSAARCWPPGSKRASTPTGCSAWLTRPRSLSHRHRGRRRALVHLLAQRRRRPLLAGATRGRGHSRRPGPVRSCLRERHQPGHTAARLAPAPAGRTRRSARPGPELPLTTTTAPPLARQGDRQRGLHRHPAPGGHRPADP